MQSIDTTDPDALSLDQLRRVQRTLERRARVADHHRLLAVGFAPPRAGGSPGRGITAQLLVQRRYTGGTEPARRAAPASVASVRVHDRSAGCYHLVRLPTELVPVAAEPQPVGTAVRDGPRHATSAAVIRWTTVTPPPADPTAIQPDDPRWRWGLLCVAHLLGGGERHEVQIDRAQGCGGSPATIEGHVVAAGRLPGGPDAALLETGLDRLWLSGLLPDPAAPSLQTATDRDLLHWIHHGVGGYAHQHGRLVRWRLQTYLPQQTIRGLGRLRHLMRFAVDDAAADQPAAADGKPFGPGTSGSILVAAGAPLAMQVAAEAPLYRVAYAQLFQAITPWIGSALGASRVALVRVF